ncbi:S8 family serine peptidase [Halobacteria archaeon AArc-m2/3/4]|uniref:S8 family serine peptidase n=1 Tax=Natronoglomus mannanivorans TaxID=2979990 RepID=A0ABT2QE45_9EURY|nr:S8 family serine peptidase [Halobacteria archaeon AArc-m2/3/4]
MTETPRDGRSKTAVVLVFLLIISLFAPIGIGGATDGTDATSGSLVPATSADPAPLDTELETSDGTVEVLLRLEGVDETVLARSHDGVSALRSHAATTQEPFERYIETTDGIELENRFWISNALLVSVDTETYDLERFARLEGVAGVHANHEVRLPEPETVPVHTTRTDSSVQTTEYEPTSQTTYGLEQINAPQVWDVYGTKGEGVNVAVLDTGVDPDHPDIDISQENWAEFDGNGEMVSSDPHDNHGHGTHVSGTVTGGDASGEYIGVAPEATLLHGKVLGDDGGDTAQVMSGMEWAIQSDADVISLSLGTDEYSDLLLDGVQNAHDADVLVVAAAGNLGEGTTGSPANLYDSFAVGASDQDSNIAEFSGGEEVITDDAWDDPPEHWPETYIVPDVAAPGVDIKSSVPGGGYDWMPGTSMATPHVSGTVALMLSASGGSAEPETILESLEASAWKPDGEPDAQDVRYGHGIIDAYAATELAVANSAIAGTVTDGEGTPIEDGTVTSADGIRTMTDENGAYELYAVPGEQTVTVDAFGYVADQETVSVVENEVTTHDVTLEAGLDAAVFADQYHIAEGGDEIRTSIEVAQLEEFIVELEGTYDESDATLTVDGVEREFGESIAFDTHSGLVTVTVDTTPDTSGELSLNHTFSAGDDEKILDTGPTSVYEEVTRIGIVDDGSYGEEISEVLEAAVPENTDVRVISSDTALDATDYDSYVVQNIDETNAEAFVSQTEPSDVGVVYLDQWGPDANGIPVFAAETGDPTGWNENINEAPPVYYEVESTHPIVEGMDRGDRFDIHDEPVGDHTWFEGTSFTVIASVGDQYEGIAGPALAVDEETNTVLASSLGRTQFVSNDFYTNEADAVLTNAVDYVTDRAESETESAAFYGTATVAGEPAPNGATVTAVVDGEPRATTTVTSGEYGTSSDPFLVDGANEDDGKTITFTVDDMAVEETATWTAGTVEELDLTVPGGDLKGTIVDDIHTEPIADATVVLQDSDGAVVSQTTTTAAGTYTFADLTPGEYTVDVTADGYAPGTSTATLESNATETVDVTLEYESAFFHLADLEAPESVDQGESVVVNAAVENVGAEAGVQDVTLEVDGESIEDDPLELNPAETETVSLEWPTNEDHLDSYAITVRTADDERTVSVVVRPPDGPPPIGTSDNPPQDTTGDGLYDDLNGDGALTVSDVQVLYDNRDSEVVQDHAYAFDFAGNGTVGVSDVQALYVQLTEA